MNEVFLDLNKNKIRDNIIRASNIRYETATDWKYEIYYAYRRKLENATAEEDEIVEFRVPMGIAIFHNREEQKRIKARMAEENEIIMGRLNLHSDLIVRCGIIKSNVALKNSFIIPEEQNI